MRYVVNGAEKKPKYIEFKKDSVQPMHLKKSDRIIISGPCEILITDFKVSGSMDNIVEISISQPRENKVIKIQPNGNKHGFE